MFFYIVLTPISTTSGLCSTSNTRKYHQIDVYISQCAYCPILTFEGDSTNKHAKDKSDCNIFLLAVLSKYNL